MRQPSFAESVALLALLISLVALSIDAMLPALPELGAELGAAHPGDTPLVIVALFLGLSAGQLVAGPLSDSLGRRSVVLLGLACYLAGAVICTFAGSFAGLIAGRVVQGFGAAGPRVVATAIVRDRYAGDAMARMMSFIMSVFILVPILAPIAGQWLSDAAGWRAIFAGFVMLGAIAGIWFLLRQPETLAREKRIPFRLGRIWAGARETCGNPAVLGYIAAAGLIYGALVGYLGAAQPMFADQYGLGARFPYYFAAVALAIGAASLVNARLVLRLGMWRLMRLALAFLSLLSTVAVVVAASYDGHPPLVLLIAYLFASFFAFGILYGNLSAAAMEPLGHIAGLASAVIASLSTFISLAIGTIVGRAYDGTVMPLVISFAVLSLLALGLVLAIGRHPASPSPPGR
jgi:DHA1 family bicyclomycin/chloramphenicol resistance-like MFS transporter